MEENISQLGSRFFRILKKILKKTEQFFMEIDTLEHFSGLDRNVSKKFSIFVTFLTNWVIFHENH